ncbi:MULTISPECIES: sigma-70 family RNA polymerase sigma factor [unclassified Streptomyces]|uniref:sigma-70 family RNA polymerase sigma factor n=1 Tax=unclassified Streptomyces TaxID=2593676 RepID=UPI002254EAD1|nr:sigma-70 family RNA polymerase sigma factor [Streptomyces sp. NBC_00103]MCX5372131.1 sigma-70 family RNA polymerase sigma factor [Streptomyces sp. NBC_00103]
MPTFRTRNPITMNTPHTALENPAPGAGLLDALMAEHSPAVIAYAERILRDRHLAEDIAQEAFIRAWPHTERLCSTAGSIRGWLLTVTRNLIIDRSRSSMARNEVVGAGEMFGADHRETTLPDHAESVATSMQTLALLHGLSPEHREVVLHLYVLEHSVRETADLIGIPVGTVKSRHHYALNALRSGLADEVSTAVRKRCAPR